VGVKIVSVWGVMIKAVIEWVLIQRICDVCHRFGVLGGTVSTVLGQNTGQNMWVGI
jgi:hypothetical protein